MMISSDDFIKKRILLIGSNGLLGQRLTKSFYVDNNLELLCASFEDESFTPDVDYTKVDITIKHEIKDLILNFYPDFVINAAAFTNVDQCETEKKAAWNVNVNAVKNIAGYCRAVGAHLTHFSTDYIFDGTSGPYSEDATPNPINYYGRSKLAAENEIRAVLERFAILRINVLYGPAQYGKSDFVKWIVDSLRSKNPIRIVNDQYNNASFTDDIADIVEKIVRLDFTGIYNIGGGELLNRLEFTLRVADFFQLDKSLITEISSDELDWIARRPLKSGLTIDKAKRDLGYRPRKLEETFKIIQRELNI